MFRLAVGATVAAAVACCVMSSAAAAQAATPPTLSGEALSASPSAGGPPWPFVLGSCGNGSPYGPDFSFAGTATGPYPGSFSESGTVSYTPDAPSDNPWGQGPVTSFSGAFTIKSPDGKVTVTGTNTLDYNGALAVCWGSAGGGGVNIGPILTTYSATVSTTTGSYQDNGASYVTLSQDIGDGEYWQASLLESFVTGPAPTGPPTIAGTALQGQMLTESHGTWEGSPTSYSYQWQRCDAPADECVAIPGAIDQTYTLTDGDVGSTIRVQEWATNSQGTGGPISSAATSVTAGVVLPPPPPPPPSPPTAPPVSPITPAPPPVTLPGNQAAVSAAQIKSRLYKQLAVSRAAARVSAILKHDGYTFSFQAPTAGRVVIRWYDARGALVATGKARFATAGPIKITLRLTAAGKRILKTAKRLKLTARASYTQSSGLRLLANRTLRLRSLQAG